MGIWWLGVKPDGFKVKVLGPFTEQEALDHRAEIATNHQGPVGVAFEANNLDEAMQRVEKTIR